MLYLAIAIAQTFDPLRIAVVVICLAAIRKTVAAHRRLPAVAILLTAVALVWSAYIQTKSILRGSPLPREFASEAVTFAWVTFAGLIANVVIAAIAIGCWKLFHVAYRKASQW